MRNKIKIKMIDGDYYVFHNDAIIFKVHKSDLSIKGKDLYDNLISKLDLKTKVEFEYETDPSLTNSNEKRIVEDIIGILNLIADKINTKFEL